MRSNERTRQQASRNGSRDLDLATRMSTPQLAVGIIVHAIILLRSMHVSSCCTPRIFKVWLFSFLLGVGLKKSELPSRLDF
jgi:hypothetical protein